jgi:epoxyqueuosine reductase
MKMVVTLPISDVSDRIKRLAREQGFDLAGIAGVEGHPELDHFTPWIETGRHGEMGYLAARNQAGELKRKSLGNTAPWARSVIVCAVNYNASGPYSTHAGSTREGWIARYAWSEADYHEVMLGQLRKLEAQIADFAKEQSREPFRSWCYVDTGPIVERVFAKYAGIGWIGKNTCILNEKLGSWLFLGVILTNLALPPDLPAADRCGSCTRCLDACPTEAFVGPHQLDASRCIAYLTIEKRGEVPQELRGKMGHHVFGCDICQDVCPWNRRAPIGLMPELQPKPERISPALDWLAAMDADEFREVFRKSPVKRTKLSGLRRNVAIAIGNSGDTRLIPAAEDLANDEDPIVAECGRWALERLRQFPARNNPPEPEG